MNQQLQRAVRMGAVLVAGVSCRAHSVDLWLLDPQPTAGDTGRIVGLRVEAPAAVQVRITVSEGELDHPNTGRHSLACLALTGGKLDTVLFVHPYEAEATVTAEAVVENMDCAKAGSAGIEPAVLIVALSQGDQGGGGDGGAGGAGGSTNGGSGAGGRGGTGGGAGAGGTGGGGGGGALGNGGGGGS